MTIEDDERRAKALDGAFLKAERWVVDALDEEHDWEADPKGEDFPDACDDPRFVEWFNEMLTENVAQALSEQA